MEFAHLLEKIDDEQEFELYKGDRIGIFTKKDKGIETYLVSNVWNISVEDNRLIVSLEY